MCRTRALVAVGEDHHRAGALLLAAAAAQVSGGVLGALDRRRVAARAHGHQDGQEDQGAATQGRHRQLEGEEKLTGRAHSVSRSLHKYVALTCVQSRGCDV